jgi:hypothetical protein
LFLREEKMGEAWNPLQEQISTVAFLLLSFWRANYAISISSFKNHL